MMEAWEEQYERRLAGFQEIDPGWWKDVLPRIRAGDEPAIQALLSRSLILVLTAARQYRGASATYDLGELVERGNYVLRRAIDSFSGEELDQYIQHLEQSLYAEWSSMHPPGS